ncbi:MAG TPA: hypothetical protein VGO09_11010, partial [Flavisolibacter sp.]|nr:hypothetical protein [Flavisolibacter sp.]
CGAARDFNDVLGLTLGTGLGAALYTNDKTEDADLWNYPFLYGIAEDYLSTRWFTGRYQELSGKSISGVKELLETEDPLSLVKIIFSEFGENLALFLLPVIEKNKSRIVVFGGNISNAFDHFIPAFRSRLVNNQVVLRKALLNEDATLIGAASSWKNFSQQQGLNYIERN